jgi:hypothetical protein
MKQLLLLVVSTACLLATYYYREALGLAIVCINVIFLGNLLLAGGYYLQMKSQAKRLHND